MIKCVIIDDEPLAVKLLEDYVGKTPDTEFIRGFTNPIEAIHFLEKNTVDLIFLDVQMPEITGIQFIKIADGKYPVVLTTAYEKYALDGYDLDIIDFLVKPISYDRFYSSVEKAKRRILGAQGAENQRESTNHLFVKSEYKTLKIDLDSILYIEGLSDYVAIYTSNGEKILTLDSLKNFEQRLPVEFMRVHKSYIVALHKIDFIERQRIVIGEKYIPIGTTYQKAFWERVGRN